MRPLKGSGAGVVEPVEERPTFDDSSQFDAFPLEPLEGTYAFFFLFHMLSNLYVYIKTIMSDGLERKRKKNRRYGKK